MAAGSRSGSEWHAPGDALTGRLAYRFRYLLAGQPTDGKDIFCYLRPQFTDGAAQEGDLRFEVIIAGEGTQPSSASASRTAKPDPRPRSLSSASGCKLSASASRPSLASAKNWHISTVIGKACKPSSMTGASRWTATRSRI